jgi:hypothetical protein
MTKPARPFGGTSPTALASAPASARWSWSKKFLLPNPQVLMWTMDRVDPQPREPEPEVPVSTAPELSDAEAIAEASQYFDLFRGGLKVLTDLGVPIAAILGETGPAIETTAAKVEPDTQPAESAPPEAAPAEPATKPPSVDDAF